MMNQDGASATSIDVPLKSELARQRTMWWYAFLFWFLSTPSLTRESDLIHEWLRKMVTKEKYVIIHSPCHEPIGVATACSGPGGVTPWYDRDGIQNRKIMGSLLRNFSACYSAHIGSTCYVPTASGGICEWCHLWCIAGTMSISASGWYEHGFLYKSVVARCLQINTSVRAA